MGSIGSVVTALTAVIAYLSYILGKRHRIIKLQNYLNRKLNMQNAHIGVSIAQAAAECWLTPDQVVEAAFSDTKYVTRYQAGAGDFYSSTFITLK